jgi:hypothetical protein
MDDQARVAETLRAARALALLTRNAVTSESAMLACEHHAWLRQVQDQARLVERLTHALGVTVEPDTRGEDADATP